MRSFGLVALVLVLATSGGWGCGAPQRETAPAEGAAYDRMVPAGAVFTARLNDKIGTTVSRAGQPFTATSTTPLLNTRGQTLVPAGALVRGTVAGLDRGPDANVRLLLDSIDAGRGPVPLSATARSGGSGPTAYAAQEVYARNLPFSAVLLPVRRAPIARGPASIGGGPSSPSSTAQGEDLDLPVGTPLQLVLTQPLYAASPRTAGQSP